VPCRERGDIRRTSCGERLRFFAGVPDLAHDDEVDACSGALNMPSPISSTGLFNREKFSSTLPAVVPGRQSSRLP
jgi:hypothetical protein